jgi:hypothetical protein
MEVSLKKVEFYSYENGEIVKAITCMSPPLETLTKACGKWDQHGCWRLNSLKNILEIVQGFQESLFETLSSRKKISNVQWEESLALHKVFMTAFLNNDTVYMEPVYERYTDNGSK